MINVLQVGLGPIGKQVVKYMLERESLNIVAGVDVDPEKSGKLLQDICEFDAPSVHIYSSPAAALEHVEASVAVLTTVSKLTQIEDQITAIAEQGLDIVSTCEELTYPWQTRPEIARRIDETCKEYGISCLATGVNPGFLMDYLPSVFTSVCRRVDHVSVERMQDAGPRRGPFRKKIGVGLSREAFDAMRESISHVGLPESVGMIAAALGWSLDKIEESLEPVLAEEKMPYGNGVLEAGENRGVEQVAKGYCNGKEVIELIFRAAVGEAKPHDTVTITGTPSFTSTIAGGINGDIATAAITVNAINAVQKLGAGLKTMLDVPVPSHFS